MLTITNISHGKCTWCQEESEVVTAQFRDGLGGTFCKKHLWQAIKMRCHDVQTTQRASGIVAIGKQEQ